MIPTYPYRIPAPLPTSSPPVKINLIINDPTSFRIADKKPSGKSKDEQMAEKKQELEKRLQDVTGQLGASKKNAKKGMYYEMMR